MTSLFPRASLKRSPRTRARKNSISVDTDTVCPPSRSSILARRKTRPPPLQIIPELSENELVIDISSAHSPATARPTQSFPQQPTLKASRITLSAYTFSIDDELFMSSDEASRSPALSASSSTSDGASSEDVPTTPGISDGEDGQDLMLLTPRPQRIPIRPLCITKTRPLICQEDEDIHNDFEKEEEKAVLPVTEELPECSTEDKVAAEGVEEAEQDFYAHEFEDFISLSPIVPSTTFSARRDSLTLVAEALPMVINVPEPKPRGRSRHSKPLPLLPPVTPPLSTFPLLATLPLVQTSAQTSIARRKRNIPSPPNHPPSSPSESRPLPRVAVPLDIEDCIFPEDNPHIPIPSRGSNTIVQVYDAEERASVYSQASFAHTLSASTRPLPPAIPETPFSGMYGGAALPRSSTDSDAPRSSVDSTSSFASLTSSVNPISPFSFLNSPSPDSELESTQCLRSRWSSSTLASLAAEPPRTPTLLFPLKNVLGSRARRVLLPPPKVPPQHLPKNKHSLPTTQSPLSTLGKHLRRRRSRFVDVECGDKLIRV
ncbi:hypothetical protein J3R82DRAFT_6405 [Butyriboletus roseoflavus]|nr:hypothetical protein J3R82DRAFT_6405 [Butyriboletus roseoflavus]